MNMTDILERIRSYLKDKENKEYIYDKDIGEYLKITPESLSRLKKNNSIPFQKIIDFCKREDISLDWILFGKNVKTDEEKLKIKYRVNILASAGGGAENINEDFLEIEIDEHLSKALGLTKEDEKYIEAINVVGDSMSPIIEDLSLIHI